MPNGNKKPTAAQLALLASVGERWPTEEELREYEKPKEVKPPREWRPPAEWPEREIREFEPPSLWAWQLRPPGDEFRQLREGLGRIPETWAAWQPFGPPYPEREQWLRERGIGEPPTGLPPDYVPPEERVIGLPAGYAPPEEWAERYGRPEAVPRWPEGMPVEALMEPPTREAISEYAKEWKEQPPVLPQGIEGYTLGFEGYTEEEQELWLRQNRPYGLALFDPATGERISWEETRELLRTNPDKLVIAVYPVGGGREGEVGRPLREIVGSIEELEILAEIEERKLPRRAVATGERTRERITATETGIANWYAQKIRAALEAGASSEDIIRLKRELESQFYKFTQEDEDYMQFLWETQAGPAQKRGSGLLFKAMQDLPDELMRRYEEIEAEGEKREPEPALKDRLGEYGIWVSGSPPYLTPLTEAQLMRLPPEVVALMKRYLSEKGMSWEDYLKVATPAPVEAPAEEWGRPVPARWAIPSQW